MTALVFVDTNVLLYAQDPREPDKSRQAQRWLAWCWGEGCARSSTQVLNGLYVNLRRVAPKMDADAARRLVRRYRAWRPWLVNEVTVDLAWEIQDRFNFSYWGGLMLAAAQQQGDSVQIIDPFQMLPEEAIRP